jgi:hypothetical protein
MLAFSNVYVHGCSLLTHDAQVFHRDQGIQAIFDRNAGEVDQGSAPRREDDCTHAYLYLL